MWRQGARFGVYMYTGAGVKVRHLEAHSLQYNAALRPNLLYVLQHTLPLGYCPRINLHILPSATHTSPQLLPTCLAQLPAVLLVKDAKHDA